MVAFPSRGQKAPQYWDTQLKQYIDEGVAAINARGSATNAQLRDRSTHTGTQTAETISDFTEAAQDAVAAMLAQGTGVVLNYNDAGNTLTVTSTATGGVTDPEVVRDTIGTALVGVGLLSVVVNDAADTITISTTATLNSTDAALRDRSTHTGTQAQSTITNLVSDLGGKSPTGHTHTATAITDSTTAGRAILTAADNAAIRALLGVTPVPIRFSAETATIAATGTDRASVARTITEARLRVAGAPTGSALTVVVQHSVAGSGTWSTVATLTVAAGSTTEATSGVLSQAQAAGDLLRLNVTSVGSTTAATGVVVDVVAA